MATRKHITTGVIFHRLTTIEQVRINGVKHWRCRCKCGTETLVSASNLNGGNSRSCGCLRKETTRQTG